MKILRFMSAKEAFLLWQGRTLYNQTTWSDKKRSTSKGFCFWNGCNPYEAYWYLGGIVNPEIAIVFEANPALLTKSVGVYASDEDFFGTQTITEYCCDSYSFKKLHPVYAYLPLSYNNWEKMSIHKAIFLAV